MSQNFRLDKAGYINKDKKISFKFNGKKYFGYEGYTLASALIANGIHLVGRSFKYHRPRGIYTCGIEEPNALVQILNEHNEPNVRATVKRIYEGIIIDSYYYNKKEYQKVTVLAHEKNISIKGLFNLVIIVELLQLLQQDHLFVVFQLIYYILMSLPW